MALLRNLVAARKIDLKFFKPRLALQRASSPEQPRVPAGQPHAGERTREEEGSHSRSNYLQVAETCQDYIPANCLDKDRSWISQPIFPYEHIRIEVRR